MCENNPVFEFMVLFVKFSDLIPLGCQVGTCPRLGLLGVDGDKKGCTDLIMFLILSFGWKAENQIYLVRFWIKALTSDLTRGLARLYVRK